MGYSVDIGQMNSFGSLSQKRNEVLKKSDISSMVDIVKLENYEKNEKE